MLSFNRSVFALALLACTAAGSLAARAVDGIDAAPGAPDLTAIRAKIEAKNYKAAITELKGLAETNEQADVFNLLGFSLRKTGDFTTSLTYYNKALALDPNHKGAREYLGELYVETGNLPKAKEQLAALEKLCPAGCEELEDLKHDIAAKAQ